MTVREIIHAHLITKGYDGLYNDDLDSGSVESCRCRLSDLMPHACHELQNCQPGFISYTGPGGWQFKITAKREKDADGEGSGDV